MSSLEVCCRRTTPENPAESKSLAYTIEWWKGRRLAIVEKMSCIFSATVSVPFQSLHFSVSNSSANPCASKNLNNGPEQRSCNARSSRGNNKLQYGYDRYSEKIHYSLRRNACRSNSMSRFANMDTLQDCARFLVR